MKNLLLRQAIALVLIISVSPLFSQSSSDITLEDIWSNGIFRAKRIHSMRSMNDGEHYCVLENNSIVKYCYSTSQKVETILSSEDLKMKKDNGLKMGNYFFNDDESMILVETGRESIYRHSFVADYYVYDIEKNSLVLLSENGKQQLPAFSPKEKNRIAFVRDNNIFIRNVKEGIEVQITSDGEKNAIINGAPDWVYEEEFSFSRAFEWSLDGTNIAFMKFDESKVKEFSMTVFNDLYPIENKFKYPKAGERNSVVSINIYNLVSKKIIQTDIGEETDQYIPRIKWTKEDDVLCITRLNRLQNKLELLLANAVTGETTLLLSEENKYYIDIHDNLTFLNDKKHFVWTSEQDGFNHIYLYGMDGKLVNQVTSGRWEVVSLKGIDEEKEKIYYISSESSPLQRDLYSIKYDGKSKKLISDSRGYNSAHFSSNYQYFINTWSNANSPTRISLYKNNGKLHKVLEDNRELTNSIKEYGFAEKKFFTFIVEDTISLNAWMICPEDFDSTKKYPVFMVQYSGPGSQKVNDAWDGGMSWYQLLAQKGYITVCVDGRGTGLRGEEFKKCTYLQLGKYETEDQISAAKYLGALPFVDAGRIGIFGWSYGGYMSTLCMTKGADYFKTGIAVAPVTNWRYYDNIYTERFMRTPQENADGYDKNSPINHVEKLKGNYLLIHGSADDNVHVQNTMELMEALVNADKQYEMQLYTNKNHGIYGGNTRIHLYRKMTQFILDNL